MRDMLRRLVDVLGGLSAWFGLHSRHLATMRNVNRELRAVATTMQSSGAAPGTPEYEALRKRLVDAVDAAEAVVGVAVQSLDAARERAVGSAGLTAELARQLRVRGPEPELEAGAGSGPLPELTPLPKDYSPSRASPPAATPPPGPLGDMPLGRGQARKLD